MPRVFPRQTILTAAPLNLKPSLNTLSNPGFPVSLPGAVTQGAPLGDEVLPVPAAPGIEHLAPVASGHPRPESVSSGAGQVAGLVRSLHVASPGSPDFSLIP